jgi:aryl-alcohol dehydrogenase-like predicted oxidoreductase
MGELQPDSRCFAVIATKFGFDVDPTTGERRGLNSQPEHIKRPTDAMLRRLGTDRIDFSTSTASIRTSPSRTSPAR